jgi:glycerophosphoryl diester phosphodiesterase
VCPGPVPLPFTQDSQPAPRSPALSRPKVTPLLTECPDNASRGLHLDTLDAEYEDGDTNVTLHERPLLIAHRAGNHLEKLTPAADAGAQIIEIDVWFHRDGLEVGHDKTLGPVPLRWDRWSLALGAHRELEVRDVLQRFPPDAKPMFDLKGTDPRLPEALQRAIAEHFPGRPYTVSSQNWAYLDEFLGVENAHVIRSVGSAKMLAQMRRDLDRWTGAGIGLDVELLTSAVIEELQQGTPLIVTWTVNDLERAIDLVRQGVGGIITDRLEVIRAMRARQTD